MFMYPHSNLSLIFKNVVLEYSFSVSIEILYSATLQHGAHRNGGLADFKYEF